jgi:hypothetical protein
MEGNGPVGRLDGSGLHLFAANENGRFPAAQEFWDFLAQAQKHLPPGLTLEPIRLNLRTGRMTLTPKSVAWVRAMLSSPKISLTREQRDMLEAAINGSERWRVVAHGGWGRLRLGKIVHRTPWGDIPIDQQPTWQRWTPVLGASQEAIRDYNEHQTTGSWSSLIWYNVHSLEAAAEGGLLAYTLAEYGPALWARASGYVGLGGGAAATGQKGLSPLEREATELAQDIIRQRQLLQQYDQLYRQTQQLNLTGEAPFAGPGSGPFQPGQLDMFGGMYNNILPTYISNREVLDYFLDCICPSNKSPGTH